MATARQREAVSHGMASTERPPRSHLDHIVLSAECHIEPAGPSCARIPALGPGCLAFADTLSRYCIIARGAGRPLCGPTAAPPPPAELTTHPPVTPRAAVTIPRLDEHRRAVHGKVSQLVSLHGKLSQPAMLRHEPLLHSTHQR